MASQEVESSSSFYDIMKAEYFRKVSELGSFENETRSYYTNAFKILSEWKRYPHYMLDQEKLKFYYKFEVRESKASKVLIKKRRYFKDPYQECLPVEDSFEVLNNLHLNYNHIGLTGMRNRLCSRYFLRARYIQVYLECCEVCIKKKVVVPRLCVPSYQHNESSLPILGRDVVLNMIDLKAKSDGNFKYLLVYLDMSTLFVVLRPIIDKCEYEIATELIKIISSYGSPNSLLVSECDMELYRKVVKYCVEIGFTINTPCIAPNTIEAGTGKYINIISVCLENWMTKTGSSSWGLGCHIIQLKLNNNNIDSYVISTRDKLISESTTIERSPHLRMFGEFPYSYHSKHVQKNCDSFNDDLNDFIASIANKYRAESLQLKKAQNSVEIEKVNDAASQFETIIGDEFCHVCQSKHLSAPQMCSVCQNFVHKFCSQKSSEPTEPLCYTCLTCSKIKQEPL